VLLPRAESSEQALLARAEPAALRLDLLRGERLLVEDRFAYSHDHAELAPLLSARQ
jgi:hypothetical protein